MRGRGGDGGVGGTQRPGVDTPHAAAPPRAAPPLPPETCASMSINEHQ